MRRRRATLNDSSKKPKKKKVLTTLCPKTQQTTHGISGPNGPPKMNMQACIKCMNYHIRGEEFMVDLCELPDQYVYTLGGECWKRRTVNGMPLSILHPFIRREIVQFRKFHHYQMIRIDSKLLSWDYLFHDDVGIGKIAQLQFLVIASQLVSRF